VGKKKPNQKGGKKAKFQDIKEGKISMETFHKGRKEADGIGGKRGDKNSVKNHNH